MSRRRAVALAVAAVLGLMLGAGWMTGGPAEAAGFPGVFSTVAAADGLRQSVIMPGAPLTATVVDLGAPSVQAAVDSLGSSRAFASLPYPGETLATGSGLVRTLSGAPVPDYPFYVQSSHPIVPEQEVAAGPYRIKAQSSESASKATATGGLAAPGSAAVGLVRADASAEAAESVIASGRSDVESFTLGPLRLGQILSTATVVLDGHGGRSRRAETSVVGVMVGDTAVTLTGAGLAVAGSNQALPGLDPVRAALAGAGITVELMPGDDRPTGVVAPAVRITQRQPTGARVLYVLGGASAFVDGGPGPAPGAAGNTDVGVAPPGPPSGPDGSGVGLPAPGARPAAVASPGAASAATGREELGSAAAGVTGNGEASAVPASGEASPASGAARSPSAATAARSAPSVAVADRAAAERLAAQLLGLQADAGPLYGALAAGGLVVLLAVGAARWRWGRAR